MCSDFVFQRRKKVTLGRFDPDANGLAEVRAKAREAQNQLTQARKPSAEALDPAGAKKAARLAAAKERAVAKAALEPQPDAFDKAVETYLGNARAQFARDNQKGNYATVRERVDRHGKQRRIGEIETRGHSRHIRRDFGARR